MKVAQEVAATLGGDYFYSLVEHLTKALNVDCALVGELPQGYQDRIRTLAVYRDGARSANFEQALRASASGQVIADGTVAWSSEARRLFPLDSILEEFGGDAYVGLRLRDSDGQVLGLIAVIHTQALPDVPLVKAVLEAFAPRASAELERIRAYEALRRREERYRVFISSSSDAMWRIELENPVSTELSEEQQIEAIFRDGYIAECNPATARLFGVSSIDELLGARLDQVVSREDTRIREELRSAIRSGYRTATIETSLLDLEGKASYRVRTQSGIVEGGKLVRIWGTTRDITELKKVELSLEASERRFGEVLESIQLPAVILDPIGAITFCNDCMARISNRPVGELLGKSWFELVGSPEESDTWAALISGGPGQPSSRRYFEGVIMPRDGAPRLIAWNTVRLRNGDDAPASLAAIGRDITDQKELEARVLQAQKFESIGRLAGGIAHDFNNLLTVVIGHTELLLKGAGQSDSQKRALASIRTASVQCAELTEKLLTIGRNQVLKPECLNLNTIVAGQEAILRNMIGSSVELLMRLDPAVGLIYADPLQVSRILANLSTNARDAMPLGGTLTIVTGNVRIDETPGHQAAGVPPGEYVRLSVTDTGVGLSEEIRAKMFDPFFTTKRAGRGTGLGLSTVYGIVTQSGGYIVVRSQPGAGAVFEILFPRAEPEPTA
ncbi:MAG TPA: ATP-binding protein [Candidatus Acidoferrales bacterium]|nr:ATP-binding protein [Candidatus Acidoferrales bacterium]